MDVIKEWSNRLLNCKKEGEFAQVWDDIQQEIALSTKIKDKDLIRNTVWNRYQRLVSEEQSAANLEALRNDNRFGKGLTYALMLAIPLWVIMGLLIWLLFR